MKKRISKSSGFTLIELLISISIFVFMTALVVAKYSNFNQGSLLTNLGYDVAITIRTAQTYGLSVRADDSGSTFNSLYGVSFSKSTNPADYVNNSHFVLFSSIKSFDTVNCGNFNTYDWSPAGILCDREVNGYNIKQGSKISDICVGTDTSCTPVTTLDLAFKRPDPEALICAQGICNPAYIFAKITVQSSDGSSERVVTVRQNGQISVGN